MEDKFYLNNCGDDDAFSLGNAMFKVDKLTQKVKNLFSEYQLGEQLSKSFSSQNLHIDVGGNVRGQHPHYFYDKWFGNGVNCEILKVGANGWQKGKVRIKFNVSIEFCPDEPEVSETSASDKQDINPPESPLDDIRRMINQESQQ